MLFKRAKKAPHAGNPQYLAGVAPAVNRNSPGSLNLNLQFQAVSETVTSGFYENEAHEFSLSYGLRSQPDVGGALNYAYENYGLPLSDVCGAYMVARHPTRPLGSLPMAFYQTEVATSIGGLIPGQMISQPLLDPNNPGSGYDIYS